MAEIAGKLDPPAGPGTVMVFSPCRTCTSPSRHLSQMLEQLNVVPFDVEEQKPYSEALLTDSFVAHCIEADARSLR